MLLTDKFFLVSTFFIGLFLTYTLELPERRNFHTIERIRGFGNKIQNEMVNSKVTFEANSETVTKAKAAGQEDLETYQDLIENVLKSKNIGKQNHLIGMWIKNQLKKHLLTKAKQMSETNEKKKINEKLMINPVFLMKL